MLFIVFVLLGSGRILHEVPRELAMVLCYEVGDALLHVLGDRFLLLLFLDLQGLDQELVETLPEP